MKISLTNHFFASSIGQKISSSEKKFAGFTTDTREVEKNFLFLALAGETRDGHEFIEEAISKGATGILHRKNFLFALPPHVQSFPVDDTLLAYRKFAKAWRKQFHYPVLAVAGSAGKTTSKELLAALLRGKFQHVHQTRRSQNGFTGIPATLLGLTKDHDAAVIEVGIDEPHTMELHLDIVDPVAGILTSIGEEHLEKLIDTATVAVEEGKIFRYLEDHKSAAAINVEDKLILEQSKQIHSAKKIYYGFQNTKNFSPFLLGKILEESKELEILSPAGEKDRLPLPLEGKHNALNLLGAAALASLVGVNFSEMKKGLASFTPPAGRSEIYTWKNSVRVYCDTYNANPLSVKASLDMLVKEAQKAARTWVCLGDMLELGKLEESLHRALAPELIARKIDHVLLFGPRMKYLAEELKQQHFSGKVQYFENIDELSETLARNLKPQDYVLIKGSRGMRMERVWDALQKT